MKEIKFEGVQPVGDVLTSEEMKKISGGIRTGLGSEGSGSGSGSEEDTGSGSESGSDKGRCICTLHMKNGTTKTLPEFQSTGTIACSDACFELCGDEYECIQSVSTFFPYSE